MDLKGIARVNLTLVTGLLVTFIMVGCEVAPVEKQEARLEAEAQQAEEKSAEIDAETAAKIDEQAANKPLYIIEEFDSAAESFIAFEVATGRQLKFSYNMTTAFLNKYDDYISSANFMVGSVVELGELLPSSGAVSSVKLSDRVWQYRDLKNYSIDTEHGVFEINGENFKITKNTRVYSDTERILMSGIGKEDVLTVIGKDKDVISVAVTTGHGYIKLKDTSLFDGSLIFIGSKIVTKVYDEATIEVPEGSYDITVANNGWGGTARFNVRRNETTEVSLESMKGEGPSYCEMSFVVTVPNTLVYIDGKAVDTAEPTWVQYGNHKLTVACEGYTTWNKTLVVNSESAVITLELDAVTTPTVTPTATPTPTTTPATGDSTNSSVTINGTNYDSEVDYLSTLSDLIGTLME